ncbi:DUF4230 domain-containing protein [Ulvibacter antarcticus]|uniref:Uncharacterized protein DUF4230 n=1 Tax=Ulvibacter antarcticus TaxID=442714 RepID=A0A3L9Z326_9FLAO|nr:DUF4230 domain-containing protein [Ulvibacter antarcticus]RMA66407.1 uncharacterized protein DUF4230 [Ulvibacter antarcticus]
MELLFIGLAVGAITAYFVFLRFSKSRRKGRTHQQSVILMEKMRSVCKLITVEGSFSEIYYYENVREKWIQAILGKKKAILLIEAKAHVGFDLNKIQMESDPKKRTIILTNFPQPELLSVDTDFKYYDKKEGWANPFTSADLTEITSEAKQHILDKVPESGLFEEASKQAMDSIQLMETLVETINWKLDFSALTLDKGMINLPSETK